MSIDIKYTDKRPLWKTRLGAARYGDAIIRDCGHKHPTSFNAGCDKVQMLTEISKCMISFEKARRDVIHQFQQNGMPKSIYILLLNRLEAEIEIDKRLLEIANHHLTSQSKE